MGDAGEKTGFESGFYSSIIVIGVLTNGFIISMFCFNKKLRTVTNYFVVNLAVSDFFLNLDLILWLLALRFHDQIKIPLRIYNNIVTSFLTLGLSASPASLVVVSFDRYYAITQPLRYNSFFTHRRAVFFIVGIWVYATIMYLLNWLQLARLPEYSKVMMTLLAVGNFLIPLCAVVFFYCRILKEALSHLRHTARIFEDEDSAGPLRRRQFHVARNVMLLVFPLVVVCSTYYIFLLLYMYCATCTTRLTRIHSAVLLHLPHVVAAINPIIYILLTKDFRAIITHASRKCDCICWAKDANLNLDVQTETVPLSTVS